MNYAKAIPRDTGGAELIGYPAPIKAVKRWNIEDQAESSVISLNSDSTYIEISTNAGSGALIRWVSIAETAAVAPRASVVASGLGANFHHHIQPNTVRRFVIPKETRGTYAGGVGSVNGLYQRLAWIKAGTTATSILATEF